MKNMTNKIHQWCVVGAGPAGIAAIGKLLDNHISPEHILWIDPAFEVGDLGQYWHNVSSNTTVKLFIDFLKASPAFAYNTDVKAFRLNQLDLNQTCKLIDIAIPLKAITERLTKYVNTKTTKVQRLSLQQRIWTISCAEETFQANNVVLATGCVPLDLDYPQIETIPFIEAIDKERLKKHVKPNETYAVFGSSHSAVLILKDLVDLGAHKIINFYRSPCRYAVNMGDWILFDNIGLKGIAAEWAKTHIDGQWPGNLERYLATPEQIKHHLPRCDKAIYAVGFKQRQDIEIYPFQHLKHNDRYGILAPGLFGLGIAYPERKSDPFGHVENQVGLYKFMMYLQKVLPIWLKYST